MCRSFRLGRLAIDRSVQGRGLGGDLLLATGERARTGAAEVGGIALAIDPKDENAVRWYERLNAQSFLDDPLKLILPLSVIADALHQMPRLNIEPNTNLCMVPRGVDVA